MKINYKVLPSMTKDINKNSKDSGYHVILEDHFYCFHIESLTH